MKLNWRLALLIVGCIAVLGIILSVAVQPTNGLEVDTSVRTPLGVVQQFFVGTLGSASAISDTLREMTPLLLLGIGVYLALRAGLFNIGIDGQYVIGALTCAFVALKVTGILGIVLGTLAGAAAGAAWAFPAAWIKAYRGGHEVITTIMFNNMARFLTVALINGPMKPKEASAGTTAMLPDDTKIPMALHASNFGISWSLLFGIGLVFLLWHWLTRRVAGYELQAVGANRRAAEFAGIDPKRVMLRAMLVSGAIGGLAGAFQLLTFQPQFKEGFSPGYGFDALGVALLASGSPFLLIPAAFLFGMLSKGGQFIGTFGIPRGITYVVLGMLIIGFAAVRYRKEPAHD